jgi:hypothetical protein
LDKGTVWAKENIVLPNAQDEKNMLFQAIAYRCLPNIKVFERVGLPDRHTFDSEQYQAKLERLKANGFKFTLPYLTRRERGKILIESYVETLTYSHACLDMIHGQLKDAYSLRKACTEISYAPGVAGFLAYEVLNDLLSSKTYLPKFSEDDWVFIGTGAKDALWHLDGNCWNTTKQHDCASSEKPAQLLL